MFINIYSLKQNIVFSVNKNNSVFEAYIPNISSFSMLITRCSAIEPIRLPVDLFLNSPSVIDLFWQYTKTCRLDSQMNE